MLLEHPFQWHQAAFIPALSSGSSSTNPCLQAPACLEHWEVQAWLATSSPQAQKTDIEQLSVFPELL